MTEPQQAKRFNDGKPKLSYIFQFPRVIEVIARIKELGAAKYGDGNWKFGNKLDSEYLDSMTRHLTSLIDGEFYDQDSGCAHLGHAIWNLMALLELNHPNNIIDEDLFNERLKHYEQK